MEFASEQLTVLQIALYEYIVHRRQPDVEGYVNKRYPVGEYPDWFRKDKIPQVERNIAIAEQLREKIRD